VKGFAILGTILASLIAWLWVAAGARADTPGCESQFWMIGLRGATRTICDGPIQADGSWQRSRQFYARAFTSAGFSTCYGYGICTFTLPREIPALDRSEVYRVTPQTVLPDEPGHIPATALA